MVEVRLLCTVSFYGHRKPGIVLGNFLSFFFFFHVPKSSLNVPFVVELELVPSNAEPQTDP